MVAIVLDEGSQQLAVSLLIPVFAVVLELYILLALLVLRTLYLDTAMYQTGTACEFVALASPCIIIVIEGTNSIKTLLIELCQLVEVELSLQITC